MRSGSNGMTIQPMMYARKTQPVKIAVQSVQRVREIFEMSYQFRIISP